MIPMIMKHAWLMMSHPLMTLFLLSPHVLISGPMSCHVLFCTQIDLDMRRENQSDLVMFSCRDGELDQGKTQGIPGETLWTSMWQLRERENLGLEQVQSILDQIWTVKESRSGNIIDQAWNLLDQDQKIYGLGPEHYGSILEPPWTRTG